MKSTLIVKSAGIIAIAGACLALTSCGGWSNNLADPSTAAATSCSSLGVTCVTGRLVDDVAYNVDYECGLSSGTKVQSVTGADGSFSCPAGSLVTFSIINPDHKTSTDKKIVLGQADVVSPASLYGTSSSSSSSSTPTVYTYLTPRDLASDTSSATTFSTTTINIVRLLQTLGRDPNASTEGTPAHRVVLDDNDKRQLTNLAANITLADFGLPAALDPANPAPGTFDSKVASYLLSLPDPQKHYLISQDAAAALLQHGVYSFAAGMYTVPGSAVTTSGSGISTAGLSGTDPTYGNLLGTLYLLVDRQGRMLGSGVYSLETTNLDTQTLWTNPKALELSASGLTSSSGYPVWPNNFSLTNTIFNLLDSNGVVTGKTMNIRQGSIERQAIAGTDTLYQNLFGEAVDKSKLGQWALMDGATTQIAQANANYTLEHTDAAAPTLDPDLWAGATDPVISKLPLAVTAYFCNSDSSAPPDSKCNQTGAVMATVRFVILADGNIVSDINHHCGVDTNSSGQLDPVTLTYASDGSKEVPLGTVVNIFSPASGGMTFMSLLLMMPNNSDYATASQYLPYAQFGENLGSVSLLRVDGNPSSNSSYLKMYNASTDSNGTTTYSVDTSVWGNALTTYRYFSAQHQENPHNLNPFTYSAATMALKNNAAGLLLTVPTAPSDCI